MKLTESQLRQIIREEIFEAMMQEEKTFDNLKKMIDHVKKKGGSWTKKLVWNPDGPKEYFYTFNDAEGFYWGEWSPAIGGILYKRKS